MAERTQCDRADKTSGHRRQIEHRCRGARIAAALPELTRAIHAEDQLPDNADRREHCGNERRIRADCNSDERGGDRNYPYETALYGMTEFRPGFGSRPDPLRRIQQHEYDHMAVAVSMMASPITRGSDQGCGDTPAGSQPDEAENDAEESGGYELVGAVGGRVHGAMVFAFCCSRCLVRECCLLLNPILIGRRVRLTGVALSIGATMPVRASNFKSATSEELSWQ